jgi:putative MFS transporter
MSFQHLDSAHLKRFQRRVTLLSAAGTFLDGYDLTVIAVTLPFLVKQWHISPALSGLVASSAVIGVLIGSLVFGNLTDKFGRKAMYVIDLLSFVIFAALTAFAQNVWQLIIFRFLLGLGIGADYPISATLVAEFSSSERRGRQGTSLAAIWFVGAVAAYVVGILFMPFGANAWRYMLLLGAIFALVVFFLRSTIPESPRWLASKGRIKEAEEILKRLTDQQVVLANETHEKHGLIDIFSGKLWRRTLFVCGFWFTYAVAYYGITMYTPTILKAFTHGSQTSANIGSAIISILGVCGAVLGSYLVEVWGRRPLMILAFSGLTGALAILAVNPHPTMNFLVILFSLAVLFATMGPGILNFVYPTELFPTSIRASASGFATALSRVGAILGILVFPNLVTSWGIGPALWLFTLAGLIGLIFSIWLAPETKGRNLEDLNDEKESHFKKNEILLNR